MTWWEWYNSPGPAPHVEHARDPYDVATWGNTCARGAPYAETGAPIPAGQAGGVRKISTGRKSRGSAADDLARQEARNP
jgi:hypothetical protein